MKDTKIKNKIIGAAVIFIIGIISGWFSAREYFKPIPVDPATPSVVTIIDGKPGAIQITDERFYPDYFQALVTASGPATAIYKVNRPQMWREKKYKHFIGCGPSVGLTDNGILYGGWASYRYNFFKQFSFVNIIFVSAQASHYDIGLKIGVEMGVR